MQDGHVEKSSGFFSKLPGIAGSFLPNMTMSSDKTASTWTMLIYVLLIILFVVYVILASTFNTGCRLYRSNANSIKKLISLRRLGLGSSVDIIPHNDKSVCSEIVNKNAPYNSISSAKIALLQWRPLTVRLAGYLGGICSARDGVFDMAKGIQVALSLGARSFVFDIDYLDKSPCQPLLIHRDSGGIMRSLNTGSIQDGMASLKKMAFSANQDPVIIILYLRRIPSGQIQADNFLTAIASALDPISTYHLGLTEQGNFHSCGLESSLFTSDITTFQKKFIVLCNYDTTLLSQKQNPKDNLNFWVNARLWQHELSTALISSITPTNTGQIAPYAKIGSAKDFLTIPGSKSDAVSSFNRASSTIFTVALSPVDEVLTVSQMKILLNDLGIHCVPIDVIRLAETKDHVNTLKIIKKAPNINVVPDLTDATYKTDPLSFWTYAGWSRFNSA
uniref:Phosphatidylinositol-specific phospholipase C X domain-containing protein n=1 Tax=viral metagenome TaxID=1070528 RepID=A0A6C0AN77_9ZZZZ